MKRNHVRVLSICITAAMLLAEPAAAFAANTEQTVMTENTQEGNAPEGNALENGEENGTPAENGEESRETPEEGDGNKAQEESEENGEGENVSDETEEDAEGEAETDSIDSEGNGNGEGEGENPAEDDGNSGENIPTEDDKNGEDGEDIPGEDDTEGTNGENVPSEKDENDPAGTIEEDIDKEGESDGEEETELTEEEKKKLLEEEKLLEEQKLLEQKLLNEKNEKEAKATATNGVWNIRDFGAGTGNANTDTYAINQALGSVASGASTVLIPKGTYYLVGWLNVPSNATIIFEDGAKLQGDGKCGGFLLKGSGIRIEKPAISNVSIGIKAAQSLSASDIHIIGGSIQPVSAGVGIETEGITGAEINGVSVTGSKMGIYVNGGKNIQILNNVITSQSQAGIWVQKGASGASGIRIERNTVKTGLSAGIYLDSVQGTEVLSNTVEENGNPSNQSTYGIKIKSGNQVTVQGNTISNNKKDGINIDGGSVGIRVASNKILRNGAIGICAGGGSSLDITGNEIKQNQDHGIILIDSYGAIKSNTIDGTNSVGNVTRENHYGIAVVCKNGAYTNKTEITNNTVTGMVGNGIQVTGDKLNPGREGAVNVLVSANQISNVKDNGITVNYNSHNANVTGNTVNNAGVNGIDVQGGSRNCKVTQNTVNNSGNMGISIGAGNSGAVAEVTGNKVTASKNVGIHVGNSASTATVSNNQVSNHSGNFSIAVVKQAKVSLASNTVILPMDYISKYENIVKYAIYIEDGTSTTNGAVKFNFKPNIPSVGSTKFTGSGTPGLTVILNMNGSSKNAVIDSKWNYSIACNALKATDSYSVSAKDQCGNLITYTNGTTINNGNEADRKKITAFVERMYTVALNRPADTNGCNYWVEQLIAGTKDGATVAKGFILSSEMDRRKLNNEQYVTVLYRTFMDRTPAANDNGKKFWINLLENGVSRAYVFRGFSSSKEFASICQNYGIIQGDVKLTENRDQNHNVTMYVYRCYDRTMGRQPDVNGMNHWTGEILQKRRTPTDVAGNFVFSAEFKNKKYSDEEFVKVMYRMFFDREYDAKGLAFWVNELKTGKRDRYSVFLGFANSKEFAAVLKSFGL